MRVLVARHFVRANRGATMRSDSERERERGEGGEGRYREWTKQWINLHFGVLGLMKIYLNVSGF